MQFPKKTEYSELSYCLAISLLICHCYKSIAGESFLVNGSNAKVESFTLDMHHHQQSALFSELHLKYDHCLLYFGWEIMITSCRLIICYRCVS